MAYDSMGTWYDPYGASGGNWEYQTGYAGASGSNSGDVGNSPYFGSSGTFNNPYATQYHDPISAAIEMSGTLDQGFLKSMPTWNVNDPNSAQAIKDYTGVANAGTDLSGISAFMRGWSPTEWTGQGGDVDSRRLTITPGAEQTLASLSSLADQLESVYGKATSPSIAKKGGLYQNPLDAQYDALNDRLRDFRFISGINPNQTGRQTNEVIYHLGSDGNLTPVWGRNWEKAENHGWARSGAGADFMSAMSLMMPAIGGVIGAGSLAGAGAGEAAGGITGTGGQIGLSSYGGAGLGSTLGTAGTGSLGSGLAGAAGTGSTIGAVGGAAGGIGGTLANMLGYGQEYAQLPGYAQGAINGALQGAGSSIASGNNPLEGALTGGLMGGITPGLRDAISGMGLGQTATGALTGAATGGLKNFLTGGNSLTGMLTGGAGGFARGGISELGGGSSLANMAGNYASQLTGSYIQDRVKNEVLQGRQDLLNNLYSEAERRGISRQQLNQFLQTAQGRQAAQALLASQPKGSLQSLFG